MKAPNILRVLGENKLKINFIQTPFLIEENVSKKPIFELNVGGTCLIFLMKEWVVIFLVYVSISQITWVPLLRKLLQSVGPPHLGSGNGAQAGQPQPWGIKQLHGTGKGWARILTLGWGLGSGLVRWTRVRYCFRTAGHGHGGGVGHQQLLPVKSVEFECSSWCHCTTWSCIRQKLLFSVSSISQK